MWWHSCVTPPNSFLCFCLNFSRWKFGGPSYRTACIVVFFVRKNRSDLYIQYCFLKETNQTANCGHHDTVYTGSTLMCCLSSLGSWLCKMAYTPLQMQACLCHMSSKTEEGLSHLSLWQGGKKTAQQPKSKNTVPENSRKWAISNRGYNCSSR